MDGIQRVFTKKNYRDIRQKSLDGNFTKGEITVHKYMKIFMVVVFNITDKQTLDNMRPWNVKGELFWNSYEVTILDSILF